MKMMTQAQKRKMMMRVIMMIMRISLIIRSMGIIPCMLGMRLLYYNDLLYSSEILDSKYIILKKLGWGHFSTVWLSFNIQDKKLYALKSIKSNRKYLESAYDEEAICKIIADNHNNPTWIKTIKQYYKN
jgi:serine/threonine protein kinase